MKKWLQRIRGAVGMGLTWAAAWSGVGVILGLVTVVLGLDPAGALFFIPAAFAATGFVGGGIFSVVLGIAEGRRRFDQMSIARFAVSGAVGGFILAGVIGALLLAPGSGITFGRLGLMGAAALMCAGSAAGSLALARRSEDRELLEAGEEALGLTEGG